MYSRPTVCLALCLLLVTGLAVGCKREPARPGGGTVGADGSFTTAQTPDGEPLVATFPGKPEWADIPDTHIPAKGYVWPGDGTRKPHAVWVWTVPPEERRWKTDHQIALHYGSAAAGRRPSDSLRVWPVAGGGVWVGGEDNAPRDPEQWHDPNVNLRNPPRNRPIAGQIPFTKGTGAGAAVVVGDKVYGVRVTGEDASFDDPEFKALFDSVLPAEIKNRPDPAKAPDDDLRPLARVGNIHPHPNGLDSGGGAVLTGRGVALFAVTQNEKDNKPVSDARLLRFRYPTFAADGEYRLPLGCYALATDDARNRVFLAVGRYASRGRWPQSDTQLVRFEVSERLGAGKTEEVKEWKSATFTGALGRPLVTVDDRMVYALHTTAGDKVEVVCVETEGMTVTRRLPLAVGTRTLCLSPDEKTLYASVHAGRCRIQEVDAGAWRVRRSFDVTGHEERMACGPDGRLYLDAIGPLNRVDQTGPGEPVARVLDSPGTNDLRGSSGNLHPSRDGKRLYILPYDRYPVALDIREAFDYGRSTPPSAPDRWASGRQQYYSPEAAISSDGKSLFLHSGHVFWLTGAGPLPAVDPAARWKP